MSALSNILFQIKIDGIKYKRAWENRSQLAVVAESHDIIIANKMQKISPITPWTKIRVDDRGIFSAARWEILDEDTPEQQASRKLRLASESLFK